MRPRVGVQCGTPTRVSQGVAIVGIYPCGKALGNQINRDAGSVPFPSRQMISDRSSPSRVRYAASAIFRGFFVILVFPVDLFIVVVAPTICSLTICLVLLLVEVPLLCGGSGCRGTPFMRRIRVVGVPLLCVENSHKSHGAVDKPRAVRSRRKPQKRVSASPAPQRMLGPHCRPLWRSLRLKKRESLAW